MRRDSRPLPSHSQTCNKGMSRGVLGGGDFDARGQLLRGIAIHKY